MEPSDEGIEELLDQIVKQKIEEENEIAALTEEVAYMEKLTSATAEKIKQAELEYEEAVNSYERDLNRKMVIQNKLNEAAPLIEELKEHFIALGRMEPGCQKLQEYLIAQITADTKKLKTLEAEINPGDLESLCYLVEKEADRQEQLHKTEKEEVARQIAQLQVEIEQMKINSARKKKNMAKKYEPQINMYKEKTAAVKKRLQEEFARRQLLKEEIAQKAAREQSLKEQIAEANAELAAFTESFDKKNAEDARNLAQLHKKIAAEHDKLVSAEEVGLELKAEKTALIIDVEFLISPKQKRFDRLAKVKEARCKEEAELAALQEGNSQLRETVEHSKSKLRAVQSETKESKQKLDALNAENKRLNEVCESNRKTFEANFADQNQQIAELKAKAVTVEAALKLAGEEKVKLEAILKGNETLLCESKALAAQNEETSRRIAIHKQNLEKSSAECQELSEKLAETRRIGDAQILSLESTIEEKIAILKDSNDEVAILEEHGEELLRLIEQEKALLAQEEQDSEKRTCEVKEECERKLKAAEEERNETVERRHALSRKFEEQHSHMRDKFGARCKTLADNERNLAIQLQTFTQVQENIAHLQDLLTQTIEKDNKQVIRAMKRQLQQSAANCAADISDDILPASFSPILSDEPTRQRSSQRSSGSAQSPKSTKEPLSSEDIFDTLLSQPSTATSKGSTQRSQENSQSSVPPVTKKSNDTKKQLQPSSKKPVPTRSSKKSKENAPPAEDKSKTPVKSGQSKATTDESRFSSLRSRKPLASAQSAKKPSVRTQSQDDVYDFAEGSGSPVVISSQKNSAERSPKSPSSIQSSKTRTEKPQKTAAAQFSKKPAIKSQTPPSSPTPKTAEITPTPEKHLHVLPTVRIYSSQSDSDAGSGSSSTFQPLTQEVSPNSQDIEVIDLDGESSDMFSSD